MSHPPISHIAVVVPAMDEAQTLGDCLASIGAAVRELHWGTARHYTSSVVVVLDSCTDASARVVGQFVDVVTLAVSYATVGRSRADGIRKALAELGSPRSSTWIANTDADSTVPLNWLTEQVRLADIGADALVGTVEPRASDLSDHQARAWQDSHPDGRAVGHVHGANLGVRASAYLRLGGFAAQKEHEDVDIVARLRALPAVVVASDAFPVITSGRTVGRTPGGYAGYMRRLEQLAQLVGPFG
jgi:glycosyltransferase involved in cell wall biosynthesis